jgi:hypothetical protein
VGLEVDPVTGRAVEPNVVDTERDEVLVDCVVIGFSAGSTNPCRKHRLIIVGQKFESKENIIKKPQSEHIMITLIRKNENTILK